MRALDWVDRLAGIDTLEPHAFTGDGGTWLTPEGEWLTWPRWRRLLDLTRARVQGQVMSAWFWLRWRENRDYTDVAFGMYDIHLQYRYDLRS